MKTEFERRFREALWDAGLNQSRLAEAVGVSNSYLYLIIVGKRTPNPELRQSIARALKVKVGYLFGEVK